jgi:LysR family transcriptional regulator, regulator for bpeEF and oprC
MDLFEAMRAFVHVVESGNYTKAALLMSLHKATVSEQIQQLEDKLGTRLLTRTTRSVTPTVEGLAYYQRACAILQQIDETETALRKSSASPEGPLRVEVTMLIGRLVVVAEIRSFIDRYPKITLELGCTDRVVDLIKEGVDCAVRGGELPDSGLSARRIGDLRFVVCAAPRYIEEYGLPQQPEELAHHTQVGRRSASTGKTRPIRLIREGGHHFDVVVPARFITTDSSAMLTAGLNGIGIIQLDEFTASQHLESGALVRILPSWRCAPLPINLVTPTSRKRAARVQAFMDWAHALLLRRLGSHLETGVAS